jgi:tetratricopeptide (TPR) repeat protein/O-antigen ligase
MNKLINNLIYFIVFIPPLVFFTDLTRNPYYFQIMLLNAATVLLWLVWLYGEVKKGTLELKRTPLDLPLWVFFCAATLSIILAFIANIRHPYYTYGIYSEGSKRWLFLLVNALLVYYIGVYFVNDSNRKKIMLTAIWAGIVAAAYGVLQYFGLEFIWPKVLNPFGGRSVSTFGNPNFLSSYLVMLFPLIFVFFWQAQEKVKRNFYFIAFALLYGALLCTMTRSSWGGAFTGVAVVVFCLWKFEKEQLVKRVSTLVVFGAVMLAILVMWPRSKVSGYNPGILNRLTEVTATKTVYQSYDQRRLIWSCAWIMAAENPLLGKGWGCFELFYPAYQGRHLFLPSYHTFRTHANNSHNEILEILSQTGLVGFGVYLWFLAVFFAYGYFLIKNLSGEKRYMAMALWASTMGMLVDNLMNVSLHFAVPGFLYWLNVGLLASLGATESKFIQVKEGGRKLAVWLVIIFGAFLIVRYARSFIAEVHYFNGFKLSKRNDPQSAIKELEAAHALQRLEVNNNYELANCYARTGQRDKALWAYAEALRANAGYDEIYFNMATVLAQKGDLDKAMPEYTRSLYINPLSYESYMALGSIFLSKPDTYAPACIPLLEQCAYFYPNSRDVMNNLGFLYTKVNNNEEALTYYKRALEIDPDFDMAKKNISVILSRMGRKDDFLEKVETLLRRTERDIISKNWGDAVPACEKLVKLIPRSAKANLYMANIYFTVGKLDSAIASYKTLISIDPGNLSGITNLGLAYFEAKQFSLAKEQLSDALTKDPNNNLVKQRLIEIDQQLAGQVK